MKYSYLLSIVTICKNDLENLKRTWQSVQILLKDSVEWVVIDGDSTDGTKEFISKLEIRNFKYLSEPDSGIYDAQNKGITLCQGKYINFLNAGDTFITVEFEKFSSYLDQNLDLIYGNVIFYNPVNNESFVKSFPEKLTEDYFFRDYLCHQSIFFNSSLFGKYGLYDKSLRYTSDHDFIYKVLTNEKSLKTEYLQESIVKFLIGGLSTSESHRFRVLREFKKIKIRNFGYLKFLRKHRLSSDTEQVISDLDRFLFFFLDALNQIFQWFARLKKKLLNSMIVFGNQCRAFFEPFREFRKGNAKWKVARKEASFCKDQGKKIIVFMNTSNQSGGATIAALRLYSAFSEDSGIKIFFLSKDDAKSNLPEFLSVYNFSLFLKLTTKILNFLKIGKGLKNPAIFLDKEGILHSEDCGLEFPFRRALSYLQADLLHIHWIQDNFISLKSLKGLKLPVIWTLHDFWPVMGTAHYPTWLMPDEMTSKNVLNSLSPEELYKAKIYKSIQDLTFVSVSEWCKQKAQESKITKAKKVIKIFNGIDLKKYRPVDRDGLRKKYDIGLEKRIILFGAMHYSLDIRKGYGDIRNVQLLLKNDSDILWMTFGEGSLNSFKRLKNEFQQEVIQFGRIQDEELLNSIYNLADVFLIPSRSETFCQTAAESLASGTPISGYNYSAISELIVHGQEGYLAKPFEVTDLVKGLSFLINKGDLSEMRKNCRIRAERFFDMEKVKEIYRELYESRIGV